MGPAELAEAIYESDPNRVIELWIEIPRLLTEHGLGEIEAAQRVDSVIDPVSARLVAMMDLDAKRGLTPRFRRGYDHHLLIGIGHTAEIHPEPFHIRRRLVNRTGIQSALRTLTDRQFEFLCSLMLQRYGIPANLTRGTKEGGIDFWAVSHTVPKAKTPFGSREAYRLVGQAKNMALVGDGEVHEFLSQVGDFQQGKGMGAVAVPGFFSDSRMPLVPVMMAAGAFSGPASALALRQGLLVLDGEQLAEDLCWLFPEWFDQDQNFQTAHVGHQLQNLVEEYDGKSV